MFHCKEDYVQVWVPSGVQRLMLYVISRRVLSRPSSARISGRTRWLKSPYRAHEKLYAQPNPQPRTRNSFRAESWLIRAISSVTVTSLQNGPIEGKFAELKPIGQRAGPHLHSRTAS